MEGYIKKFYQKIKNIKKKVDILKNALKKCKNKKERDYLKKN